MQIRNNLTAGTISLLLLLWLTVSATQANPPGTAPGIAEFARCSRQCVAENQQCHKKMAKQCKGDGADCFEACTVAYPACMAKCPKPGSSAQAGH